MPDRAVMYVTGDDQEVAEQMQQCQDLCIERHQEVVAVARELQGSTDAWEDAHRMVRDGEADRIVMASGAVVPDVLESATGGIPGSRRHRRPGERRIKFLRRGGGA
jgi:hypothetical protein